ncbi:hypothetical protein RI129_000908 [Pyrocoelia pectoralis]|uniref:DUF4806 domain-containing protein n=1 Tax=Pyrocoelia pectoralis TaxID=417401 RepID=A0AAN7VWD7_9COLE
MIVGHASPFIISHNSHNTFCTNVIYGLGFYFICYVYVKDDLIEAKEKEKKAEACSDLEETQITRKRTRVRPLRFREDTSEEESAVEESQLPRPPKITNTLIDNRRNTEQYDCTENGNLGTLSPITSKTNAGQKSQCSESPSLDAPSTSTLSTNSNLMQSSCRTPSTSLNSFSGDQVFQNRFIGLLSRIVEQNKEILKILKNTHTVQNTHPKCPDLPVSLPLSSFEDFLVLENYLSQPNNEKNLCAYLSTLDRNSLVSATNSALKYCLSFELAQQFSYLGTRNNKKPFSIYILKKVIVDAVKVSVSSSSREIEDQIKIWLKRSPKSHYLEVEKQRKFQNNEFQ